jgi:hypothetical protein
MGGQMPDADEKARSADTSSSSYGYPPSAPPQHQHQYGTFGPPSGASGQFPQPAVGFPQPAPPPGMQHYPQQPPASYAVYPPPQQPYAAAAPYYAQGYQVAQGTEGPNRALRCEFCAASLLIPSIELINGGVRPRSLVWLIPRVDLFYRLTPVLTRSHGITVQAQNLGVVLVLLSCLPVYLNLQFLSFCILFAHPKLEVI